MLHLQFTPFPDIVTERLILRQLSPDDASDLSQLRSDDRVNTYLDRKIMSVEDADAFISKASLSITGNEWMIWALTTKLSDRLIGTICLWKFSEEHGNAELGYELHPDFQAKGYMQEALSKVLDYGFNVLKLKSIDAFTLSTNEPSTRLLERNNFARVERVTREETEQLDSPDQIIYSLNNYQMIQ